MSRAIRSWEIGKGGFPRVSGDEPVARSTMRPEMLFSPRERGCAPALTKHFHRTRVFPA